MALTEQPQRGRRSPCAPISALLCAEEPELNRPPGQEGSVCREAEEEKPRSVTNYLSKTGASGSWLQMGGEGDAPRSSEVRPPGFEAHLFLLAMK